MVLIIVCFCHTLLSTIGEFPQFEVMHDDIRLHGDTALLINFSKDRDAKVSWVVVKKAGQWRIISMTFTVISMY